MESSPSDNVIAPDAMIVPYSHDLSGDEVGPGGLDQFTTGGSDRSLMRNPSLRFDGADDVGTPTQSSDFGENSLISDLKASNAGEPTTGTRKCNGEPSSSWQQYEIVPKYRTYDGKSSPTHEHWQNLSSVRRKVHSLVR
jgi:hypothetical protein